MKLYDYPFSPNCRKVRAVAYELGIELDYIRVNLLAGESRTPEFLLKNGNGRVPVLEDGEFVLWESNAIIAYLAATHGGTPSLLPSDLRERAEVDRWLSWQVAHPAPAFRKVAVERIRKSFTGGSPDQAAIDAGSAEFSEFTAVLDRALDGKEYVAGPLSIADFALASYYSLVPACGLDLTPFARVSAWLERVLSRESMKRALAAAEASLPPSRAILSA